MAKELPSLPPEGLKEIATWLTEQGSSVPASVRVALQQHAELLQALQGSNAKLRQTLAALRRAMGIAPKSERRVSGDPLGPVSGSDGKRPRTEREKLEVNLSRLGRLSDWHGDIRRRQRSQMQRLEKKLATLPLEDIEVTPEEQAEDKAKSEQLMQAFAAGEEADPALQSVTETLMTSSELTTGERSVHLAAPDPTDEGVEVLETLSEERVRYDFTLTVTRVVVDVEKKVVVKPNGGRSVLSATTDELGPPHYAVTWGFLSNLAVMVAQFGMPMHRMGRLLSTDEKRFTTTSLSRMLRYVAQRFVPIYLQLVDELADSSVLSGDDTPPRVLEVKRYLAKKQPNGQPPWHEYRTPEAAAELLAQQESEPSLAATLAAELGFEFDRRVGQGPKKSLNTTTVSGRSNDSDPRSLIVLYRTHFGGFGNLLEVLLKRRNPAAKSVTVQSDLSTVNLVTEPKLNERFELAYAGCASHARRPFALHEAEDPELATFMLNFFKGIFIHEHGLDLHGRNAENVTAVRGTHSREVWQDIKDLAELMSKKWSQETKLGKAARYILRHYDKLTAYLDDPRLEATNNFSERMLRMEKLIESGSMFRVTLTGRFVLDILRTVLQTAVAAGAPLQEYVMSVLLTPEENIAVEPERFTPRAWTKEYIDEGDEVPPTEPR
jgi:hypothetical protein